MKFIENFKIYRSRRKYVNKVRAFYKNEKYYQGIKVEDSKIIELIQEWLNLKETNDDSLDIFGCLIEKMLDITFPVVFKELKGNTFVCKDKVGVSYTITCNLDCVRKMYIEYLIDFTMGSLEYEYKDGQLYPIYSRYVIDSVGEFTHEYNKLEAKHTAVVGLDKIELIVKHELEQDHLDVRKNYTMVERYFKMMNVSFLLEDFADRFLNLRKYYEHCFDKGQFKLTLYNYNGKEYEIHKSISLLFGNLWEIHDYTDKKFGYSWDVDDNWTYKCFKYGYTLTCNSENLKELSFNSVKKNLTIMGLLSTDRQKITIAVYKTRKDFNIK